MERLFDYFYIDGLFGEYDIHIDFKSNIKIMVGENGLGKTTILNIINNTISRDDSEFAKLKYYDFKEISIGFGSGEKVCFTKRDLLLLEDARLPIEMRRLYRYLSDEEANNIIDDIKNNRNMDKNMVILEKYRIRGEKLKYIIDNLSEEEQCRVKMNKKRKVILNELSGKILFLPTGRRIEGDIENTEIYETTRRRDVTNAWIHIGMRDVENQLREMSCEINDTYRSGFSRIVADILLDITNGVKVAEEDNSTLLNNKQQLVTIIDRIGESYYDSGNMVRIKEYISQNIDASLDAGYTYILKKIISLYESTKRLETNLFLFRDLCNKYLINKEIYIDNVKLDFKIIEKEKNKREIKLNQLSSGEKQIVSIFALILLGKEEDYYIIIDEPELSLSMDWQRRILADIWKIDKCKFLLAVTHSPFIFDNELDQYAVSLEEYLKARDNDELFR